MAKAKDTTNSVSAKPIIFSAEMVRALLEGRKTQTRRVIKVQPQPYSGGVHPGHVAKHPAPYIDAYCSKRKTAANPRGMSHDWLWWAEDDRCGPFVGTCPYIPGDLLWVRETFWIAEYYSYGTTPGGCEISPPCLACRRGSPVFYAADGNPPNVGNRTYGPDGLRGGAFAAPDPYAVWVKSPSIHMPRWASRLTLRITNIRAERLQDISEDDARAEGCAVKWSGDMSDGPDKFVDEVFREIWEELYPKDSPKAWNANPWVWVYEFEVIQKNIGEVA